MAMRRRPFRAGRRPIGRKFQKVGHTWQYVESEETAISRTGNTGELILLDNADWAPTATGAVPVKNVSIDLRIMLSWSPEVTTLAYDSWYFQLGIFVLDTDDPLVIITTRFAGTRALWWDAQGRNTGEQPTANGVSPDNRAINWRVKAKQRFLKYEEELRLAYGFNADVTATMADARLSVFGRQSWETP